MYNPCHPGEILREETLKSLNITVTEFAQKLGVSRQAISEIINEKRGISPSMAFRLAKALGTSAGYGSICRQLMTFGRQNRLQILITFKKSENAHKMLKSAHSL